MKPFLLLSKQSPALIAHCLQSSETTPPNVPPKLCINRHLAREHRANPALDPSCRNTVFTQVRPHCAPRRVPAKAASLAPTASYPLSALLLSSCTKASDLPRTISSWTTGRSLASHLWGVTSLEWVARAHQVLLAFSEEGCIWGYRFLAGGP